MEAVLVKKKKKKKNHYFFQQSNLKRNEKLHQEALGVLEIKQYEKYLELPSFVERRKKANFNFIKEKVWRKFQGLEEKLFVSS